MKSALLLPIILSASKGHKDEHWLFYSQYCKVEWSIFLLSQISWYWTMKHTFSAIIYWYKMIIVHFICMCLICPLSSFSSQFLDRWFFNVYVTIFIEAVKDLHKVPFPIMIYTRIGKFTIPITSNQRTPNSRAIAGFCGGIDLNIAVNHRLRVNYVDSVQDSYEEQEFWID